MCHTSGPPSLLGRTPPHARRRMPRHPVCTPALEQRGRSWGSGLASRSAHAKADAEPRAGPASQLKGHREQWGWVKAGGSSSVRPSQLRPCARTPVPTTWTAVGAAGFPRFPWRSCRRAASAAPPPTLRASLQGQCPPFYRCSEQSGDQLTSGRNLDPGRPVPRLPGTGWCFPPA